MSINISIHRPATIPKLDASTLLRYQLRRNTDHANKSNFQEDGLLYLQFFENLFRRQKATDSILSWNKVLGVNWWTFVVYFFLTWR